jgi:hypothetical protein
MSDADAAIVLDHRRSLCPLHGEPFRAQWPLGFAIFMVKGFQAVTAIDGIWDEARRLHGLAADADLDPKKLELVFDVRPICCRLSKQALRGLYVDCAIGVTRRCRVCNRKALGTEYKSQQQDFAHLCFDCVCSASSTPQGVH